MATHEDFEVSWEGDGEGVWRALPRRLVRAWMRGWIAFVAATGEPHLFLAGLERSRGSGAGAKTGGDEGGGEGSAGQEAGAGEAWRRSA